MLNFKPNFNPTPMKYILLICLFVSTIGMAQHERFESKTFMDSQETSLNYRILYPENYDADTKHPLVLFLHGAGERGDDNKAQLTHGSDVIQEMADQNSAILILPQCPKEDYWASTKFNRTKYPIDFDFNYTYPETEALHAAIELVKSFIKNKTADKKRTYITGLSMGGMGTFEAVGRYPKLFAAAMPVCGGADLNSYGKKQAKIPFWIFHGDVDGVVPVKNSRDAYKHLQDLGANVTYTEYPEVNHNSWENAFKEANYSNWFFQFRR
ncbi:MAG: putative peptidase [Psychromonas sp.]|jgi:predicted peptidase